MFPSHIYENSALISIKAFVCGDMGIVDFVALYKQDNALADFLDFVIDCIVIHEIPIKRRTVLMKNVNQNTPFEMRSYAEQFIKKYAQDFRDLSDEWKRNPPKVSSYLKKLPYATSYGAFKIHSIVSDIYYQIDPVLIRTEKYCQEYEFTLDVLPNCLSGGVSAENYISQYILPMYPDTMKKGDRKRQVKEAVKQAFQKDCKSFPRWIQMPEWPIGSDGKPMVYIGQKAYEHYSEYYFRDSVTDVKRTITQWW